MSRKPEENHTRYSFNGIETKLLVSSSKPRIHKGFSRIHKENKTRIHQKKIWQNVYVYW